VRRSLLEEYVWVSRHVTLDEYRRLPIREAAILQAAAKRQREVLLAANPFAGGDD
jgi:hypothetical protein